jgi:hypothetical protein
MMWEIVITETDPPPPIRITPPWVIDVWIGTVIVFRPKIDLFARKDGISIIHFAQRFDLLSKNFTRHSDLLPTTEEVRIQIFIGKN